MTKLRIVIASPNDVIAARDAAAEVIKEVAGEEPAVDCVEIFRWEKNVAPGFSLEPVQLGLIDPRARIADSDIVVVLLSRKLGTPIAPGKPTGTQHEFQVAYESWRTTGRPQIMVYFEDTPFYPSNMQESEQFAALMAFRFSFPSEGLYGTYRGIDDLRTKLAEHLRTAVGEATERVKKPFSVEDLDARVENLDPHNWERLQVKGARSLFTSFRVDDADRPFLRLKVNTTPGYVPNPDYPDKSDERWNPVEHSIYVTRDPIRPFEIQIGEYRALRYGREPREVPFEGVPDYSELHKLYPMIRGADHRWLRIIFAELLKDPKALEYMGRYERDDEGVRKVIARNPSAPEDLKRQECPFCDGAFRQKRKLCPFEGEARIIANDFPFGPYFHYIVFPTEQVHTWDKVTERHLFEMNWLAYRYLRQQKAQHDLSGAAGLRIGLNSSIRHLVLGRRTRTSAGASVAHVHKQIWGMAHGSVNLADHLRSICLAHESRRPSVDYLGSYCDALRSAGLIVWEDAHVVLYVPFGQIAVHELQIMIRQKGRRTFLDLTEPEIASLSKAEWIVTQLYNKLDINSFNEILLSLPFNDRKSSTFRLIFTFITREVDLAVSELSLLYVVDQHPGQTVREVNRVWPSRDPADLVPKAESQKAPNSPGAVRAATKSP